MPSKISVKKRIILIDFITDHEEKRVQQLSQTQDKVLLLLLLILMIMKCSINPRFSIFNDHRVV